MNSATPRARLRFLLIASLAAIASTAAVYKRWSAKKADSYTSASTSSATFDVGAAIPTADVAWVKQHANLHLEDAYGFFHSRDFIQLTPPIRLPGRADDKLKTEIFIQVPPGKMLQWARRGAGLELSYPPGTWVARVESRRSGNPAGWSVVDIRATRFEESAERFQVYRPASPADDAPLLGFEWQRENGEQQAQADDWVEQAAQLSVGEKRRAKAAQKARSDNACSSCHVSSRPEAERHHEYGRVHRGTDAGGLFVPASVLKNTSPLEDYAPRELNLQSQYVDFSCKDGSAPVINRQKASVTCPSSTVANASLELHQAVQDAEPHASSVCEGRVKLLALIEATKENEASLSALRADCQVQ